MKYLLNVDHLSFRASSGINLNDITTKNIYKFSNGLFIKFFKVIQDTKTSNSYWFKIFYQQSEIGLLFTKNLNLSFKPEAYIEIDINNNIFYESDIFTILEMLNDALKLDNIKLKRLDICYDTNKDIQTVFKDLYEEKEKQGLVHFKNREKIYVSGTGKDNPTTYIGSIKSKTRCIHIYNKTKEINSSHKEYIKNIHRKLLGFGNIYRIEIKIFSKVLNNDKIDIWELNKTDYIERIFNTYYTELIQFMDMKTNNKIDLIELNNSGAIIKRNLKKRTVGNNAKKMKEVVNILDRELEDSTNRELRRALSLVKINILNKYELETWYNTRRK